MNKKTIHIGIGIAILSIGLFTYSAADAAGSVFSADPRMGLMSNSVTGTSTQGATVTIAGGDVGTSTPGLPNTGGSEPMGVGDHDFIIFETGKTVARGLEVTGVSDKTITATLKLEGFSVDWIITTATGTTYTDAQDTSIAYGSVGVGDHIDVTGSLNAGDLERINPLSGTTTAQMIIVPITADVVKNISRSVTAGTATSLPSLPATGGSVVSATTTPAAADTIVAAPSQTVTAVPSPTIQTAPISPFDPFSSGLKYGFGEVNTGYER